MKVFISWSGKASRVVAEALRNWLPDVLQAVEPFVSSYDIGAGDRFPETLQRELAETHFGILCLTPANHQAPWVLFEAGALAKTYAEGRICPYLINLSPGELKQPLSLYQAKTADKHGTLALVKAINEALVAGQISEPRLERSFERWWPEFRLNLEGVEIELAPTQSFQSFFLVQKSTGRCLHAAGSVGKNESEVKLEHCTDVERQKWSFHYLGKGLVAVSSRYSGLCLDVEKHSGAPGARVFQYTFKNKDNQMWSVEKVAQGEAAVRIRVEHTGFYLAANQSGAIQVEGAEGDDRLWYLQPGF